MLLTVFGALAAVTMVTSYALESRATGWIAVFAGGCLATAVYGVLSGAWIFAILESIWAVIALARFRRQRMEETTTGPTAHPA